MAVSLSSTSITQRELLFKRENGQEIRIILTRKAISTDLTTSRQEELSVDELIQICEALFTGDYLETTNLTVNIKGIQPVTISSKGLVRSRLLQSIPVVISSKS